MPPYRRFCLGGRGAGRAPIVLGQMTETPIRNPTAWASILHFEKALRHHTGLRLVSEPVAALWAVQEAPNISHGLLARCFARMKGFPCGMNVQLMTRVPMGHQVHIYRPSRSSRQGALDFWLTRAAPRNTHHPQRQHCYAGLRRHEHDSRYLTGPELRPSINAYSCFVCL